MKTFIYLLAALLLASPANAAIARVQAHNGFTSNASPCTINSGRGWASSAAGDLIIIGVMEQGGNNFTAPTDNLGDTYTQLFVSVTTTCNSGACAAWYLPNAPAGITSISMNNTAVDNGLCWATEYSGIATVNPLDKTTTQNASASPWTSQTVTTTQANELLFGIAFSVNQSGSVTLGVNGSWTLVNSNPGFTSDALIEEQIVSTIQTGVAATGSSTLGTTDAWIFTFKAAGAAPPANHAPPLIF